MKVKVHWIIDGIAEIEADDIVTAEKNIHSSLEKIVQDNKIFTDSLGAKAIQGKGYLPGSAEQEK